MNMRKYVCTLYVSYINYYTFTIMYYCIVYLNKVTISKIVRAKYIVFISVWFY